MAKNYGLKDDKRFISRAKALSGSIFDSLGERTYDMISKSTIYKTLFKSSIVNASGRRHERYVSGVLDHSLPERRVGSKNYNCAVFFSSH
jgi:hypothetical protein